MITKFMIGYEDAQEQPPTPRVDRFKWLREIAFYTGDMVEAFLKEAFLFLKAEVPKFFKQFVEIVSITARYTGDTLGFLYYRTIEFLVNELPVFLHVVSRLVCIVFYILFETIKRISEMLLQWEKTNKQEYYSLTKKRRQ